jgi:hypothetical protein
MVVPAVYRQSISGSLCFLLLEPTTCNPSWQSLTISPSHFSSFPAPTPPPASRLSLLLNVLQTLPSGPYLQELECLVSCYLNAAITTAEGRAATWKGVRLLGRACGYSRKCRCHNRTCCRSFSLPLPLPPPWHAAPVPAFPPDYQFVQPSHLQPQDLAHKRFAAGYPDACALTAFVPSNLL